MNRLSGFFLMLSAAAAVAPAQLRLPPGLEQTLPLNKKSSWVGDHLRVVDCAEDKYLPYGTCGNDLFGGRVILDAHVEGSIHVRFSPPVDNVSHFQIFLGVLQGDASTVTAPRLFGEFPYRGLISDISGEPSEGDLNLATGEVTNFHMSVSNVHSLLLAVGAVNPKLPAQVFRFPGQYGDAWASFQQRPDGLLDVELHASTFLPLGKTVGGDTVRFPVLPCASAMECASVPARGTSFHPHIFLSTMSPKGAPCGANCPDIPFNTVREFTLYTHSSDFGDNFLLNIPELGGMAPGRAHLAGRLRIQFGAPTSMGTVPFNINGVLPKGLMAEPPQTPVSVPGVNPSFVGYDEILKFPLQQYDLHDVGLADDPFDFTTGMIDLETGQVLDTLTFRAFFAQNLLFALFEANRDRLAAQSFILRGPALFERGPTGETVFRLASTAVLPFTGFRFPTPALDPNSFWVAGPGSDLHIFVNLQAMESPDTPSAIRSGGQDNVVASIGQTFSYSYSIPCDGVSAPAAFQYTNATRNAAFRMHRLASVTCTNSRTSSAPPGNFDTVTFSGFGSWSQDSDIHLATVQVSTSADSPYVGIQIDGGQISSVNTKPAEAPVP